ncbi:MAG: hypothetical protein U0838_01220 [Chloroflexota bacterium]
MRRRNANLQARSTQGPKYTRQLLPDRLNWSLADEDGLQAGRHRPGSNSVAPLHVGSAFALDDQLRAGITTDRHLGSLPARAALPGRRHGLRRRGVRASYFTEGPATDVATATDVYIQVAYAPENGTAYPVIAVAPSKAALKAAFPSSYELMAMHRYNYLPLSCGVLTGPWTTSSSAAAESYDAFGSYTGIVVAASSMDLAFDGNGRYTRHTKAYVNGVASESEDAGAVALTSQSITLTPDAGEPTVYNAAFVGVQGGLALTLQNQQFTGDQFVLLPSR